MANTTNYNLHKPLKGDMDWAGKWNENADDIDITMKSHETSLKDNAISPESFIGTDVQKVQQALDYALTNNVAIKFAKMYDITGSILMINRPQNYYANDRHQLYMVGVGGGIKKTDSGFIFDATYENTGDINISNLKFESISGVGTKVWNADKIIRVKSHSNQYRNVDTIFSAPNRYAQSMIFINEHITSGQGWKFEALKYLDTTIQNCLFEDCVNGIRNTATQNNIQNTKLRILYNLMENITGQTILLGSMWGSEITGNYFESNYAYIDLKTLNSWYHYGLRINGNMFTLKSDQVTNNIPSIILGNIDPASSYGQGGSIMSGNVSNGILLQFDGDASSYITGIGNTGKITGTSAIRYIQLSKPIYRNNADSSSTTCFGYTTFLKQSVTKTITAGTTRADIIPFSDTLYTTDICSVNVSNGSEIQIMALQITATGLQVWWKNIGATDHTVTLNANIIRMGTIM